MNNHTTYHTEAADIIRRTCWSLCWLRIVVYSGRHDLQDLLRRVLLVASVCVQRGRPKCLVYQRHAVILLKHILAFGK